MSLEAEELWKLLPAALRTRDAELANPQGPDSQGRWKPGPLRELVEVLSGQFRVLEEELEQLYENHFVETAVPWALPYLGEILGIQGLPAGALARSPRAEVGHTVGYRRRKGTAPMLELLARDITGWPARAVEFFERLAATQHLNHRRPECRSFADLRQANALELNGTAFESLQRTVEVRRAAVGRGRWNIPNLGLFLWPLASFSRTAAPLVSVTLPGDALLGRRFRVHPLGFDLPLQIRPITEDDVTHLAETANVPLPLTRRLLAPVGDHPTESLYGAGLSVVLERWTGQAFEQIPAAKVLVCDLSNAVDGNTGNPVWNHERRPLGNEVALDPNLGRVVFGSAVDATKPLPRVTYHYGFGGTIGGGEYGRLASFGSQKGPPVTVAQVGGASTATLSAALNAPFAENPFIQITDSGRYVEILPNLNIVAPKEVRAADERCPALLMRPAAGNQPWTLRGGPDGSLTVNGLWIVGALRAEGDLGRLTLRHCTLAPNLRIDATGAVTVSPALPIEIDARRIQVVFENCILPPLRVGRDDVSLVLRHCIVDAGDPGGVALAGLDGSSPAGTWRLENCTLRGRLELDRLELASNSLLVGTSFHVRRRQGRLRPVLLASGGLTFAPAVPLYW